MARNIDRDEREMERRKNQLLEAGFDLFSKYGIETVSLQKVAEKADVGIATLYNYYKNKITLVVAISAKIWSSVWEKTLSEVGMDYLQNLNSYQMIEFYCDAIIKIYKEKPEVLCFSSNYKTYICREGVTMEGVKEQLEVLNPLAVLFNQKFEEAKVNGCIRTDMCDSEIFSMFSLTMLGMAERYAQGIVWTGKEDKNYTNELYHIKDMILCWVKEN